MRKGLVFALVFSLVCAPSLLAAESSQISVTVAVTQTLSVTLSPDSYAFGSTNEGLSLETAGDAFTITNDGNGLQDYIMTVGNSVDWTAATVAGDEQFVMQFGDGVSWNIIDPVLGIGFGENVAPGDGGPFGLRIIVPTSTTKGGVEQTIPVIVTAQPS